MFSFVFDVQNRSENRRKIVPWGRLGGPPGPSWGLPEASRTRFWANFTMNENNERFCEFSGSSRDGPGDPGGAQKFAKNRFFAKKRRSERAFSSIFVHKAGFHAFCMIFRRFFSKNRWKINEKNDAFFRIVACFFQHGDPHETSYFIIRKLLFHFSRFCVFSKKIVEKRVPKSRPRFSLKNHPKVVPGDPFWDPKRSRINVGEVKKPKNVAKKSILDTVGFWRFFKLKKALALIPAQLTRAGN